MAKSTNFDAVVKDLLDEKEFANIFGKEKEIEVISTGSFSLDVSLGIGGIPKKRFTILQGLESSGKTTLAFAIAKNALETGKVLYVDAENVQSEDYIDELLGDSSYRKDKRLIVAKPDSSDRAFTLMETAVKDGSFSLVILDSVASLSPQEERDKKFEENTMGIMARDIGKYFRRNIYDVRTNNTAVLLINQLRSKLGTYVPTFTAPGGMSLAFYSSVIIELKKASDIKVSSSGEGEILGIMSKFVVKKNKLAPPFRSFIIPIIFGKGIDKGRDTLNFAETLGIVKRSGPYYKFEGQTLGKGLNEASATLTNNPQILERITVACNAVMATLAVEEEKEKEETEGEGVE